MAAGVIVLFVLVFVVVIVMASSNAAAKQKAARLTKLAAIAAHLGGQHDTSGKAWGTALGPKTTLDFATRGSGSSSENWTHVEVEVPAVYPLAIHVRRHARSDQHVIARGDMVDILIGDQVFDDAFLVEAAPADVVRTLIDLDVRGLLAAHKEVDLETVDRPDGTRCIKLGFRGWVEELELIKGPLAVMAKLGAHVREAYAKADTALEQAAPGDPYRPIVDAQPARDAQAVRESEVGRVKAVRDKRAADAHAVMVGVLVVIGLVTAIGLAATLR